MICLMLEASFPRSSGAVTDLLLDVLLDGEGAFHLLDILDLPVPEVVRLGAYAVPPHLKFKIVYYIKINEL